MDKFKSWLLCSGFRIATAQTTRQTIREGWRNRNPEAGCGSVEVLAEIYSCNGWMSLHILQAGASIRISNYLKDTPENRSKLQGVIDNLKNLNQ